MELPRFDNSVPRDRFASTQSASASATGTETETPFANLFVRREGETESSQPREHDPNDSAAEAVTAVAASSEPPAEAVAASSEPPAEAVAAPSEPPAEAVAAPSEPPAEAVAAPSEPPAPNSDPALLVEQERPQEAAPSDNTPSEAAAAPAPVADLATPPAAEVTGEQTADDAAPSDPKSELDAIKPPLSPPHNGSQQAPTELAADPQALASTEAADVLATADAPAAQHEPTAEPVSPPEKGKQKRTQADADSNGNAVGNPARGKGNPSPQATPGAATTVDAIGDLVDHSTDPQSTAGKRGQEAGSETTEPRAANDQNTRAAAPNDRTVEHLLTRASARNDSGRDISQVERTQLIQRVARAIQTAPLRGGTIRLRLRPPELGSLHLEVNMEKGGLTARLETETQMARSVLLEHLPQLRARLAEQGIRIDQFDVDVSQQDTGQSQQQADQTHDPSATAELRSNSLGAEESLDDQTHVAEATRTINQKNLNVVI